MTFPDIDPVAIAIGPFQIHWYALAYLVGFIGGWLYAAHMIRRAGSSAVVKPELPEDLLPWIILGVILGGRLIYVLVYNSTMYLHNPLDALKIWQGGMSFHGGLLGAISAMFLYAKRKKLPFLAVTDVAAIAVPIGIFFGRIANFVNGELYGRATTLPVGIVFPYGGPLPRHPSQLYEAALEGLLLFAVLFIIAQRKSAWARHGLMSAVFLMGYATARFLVEFVREPDSQIGFVASGLSMGQLLCVPMFLVGVWVLWAWKRQSPAS